MQQEKLPSFLRFFVCCLLFEASRGIWETSRPPPCSFLCKLVRKAPPELRLSYLLSSRQTKSTPIDGSLGDHEGTCYPHS